jgi:hypothetical protein
MKKIVKKKNGFSKLRAKRTLRSNCNDKKKRSWLRPSLIITYAVNKQNAKLGPSNLPP